MWFNETFWPVVARHRTKVLGGVQVAIGAAFTQLPNFQVVLKPVSYGLVCMGFGVSTALLGYINTLINNRNNDPK